VQAQSLPEILQTRDSDHAVEAVRHAARAIAALHCLPFAAPDHRIELDRTDPGRMRRSAETLRQSRPDLAPVVAEIEASILASLAAIAELPTVPVHGDLKLAHLLFEEDRVVLLDLDKFAAGDPMLDVVSLLMPLRGERKTRLAGTSLARVFAEEYFAHVPAEWEERLAPHYAWAILSEASSFASKPGNRQGKSEVSRSQRRQERVDTLVEEARAVLTG
jgi:aminoglycoside phosphotransferase (APT) family kinase protein